MGVKTALAGITITATGLSTAEAAGIDIVDVLADCQLRCAEIIATITMLKTEVLTPAGTESANISTLNTQITNLS